MIMLNDLQECFMDDIRVHWLRANKKGVYFVDIQVDTGPKVAENGEVTPEEWRTMNAGRDRSDN